MDDMFLREFIDLAHTLNFQESADNMDISTSALSKHIKKMEEELEVPLFDRSTRNVRLSKFGRILLEYAPQIIEPYDRCREEIKNVQVTEHNLVNIGYLPVLGRYGILDICSKFKEDHLNIMMNISETDQPYEMLEEKKHDFVFDDGCGPANPNIKKLTLRRDHVVILFPKDHPLAEASSVTFQEIAGENLIMQNYFGNKPVHSSQKFLDAASQEGIEFPSVTTTRYLNTLLQMVEDGTHIGVVNSSEVRGEVNYDFAIVDLVPFIPFYVCVSFIPGRIRTDNAKTFLSYLEDLADKYQSRIDKTPEM